MFSAFADAVAKNIEKMGDLPRFKVDVSVIDGLYLRSFPQGSNPIYKTNTEHDCSCCKQFLRNVGNVIAIQKDGTKLTPWDDLGSVPYPYNEVADELHYCVKSARILGSWFPEQKRYGAQHTNQLLEGGETITWDHFYCEMPSIVKDPGPSINNVNTGYALLKRGLEEITTDSLETIKGLIDADNLYRGQEHRNAVLGFMDLKDLFKKHGETDSFIWANTNHPAARFKNSVIGTLAYDLSKGTELEDAVRMFESKVAPQNYKRSKALITPAMVEKAQQKLVDLGIEDSVKRRHANLNDMSVNDILFVDNTVAPEMKDGPLADLLKETKRKAPGKKAKGQSILVSDFLRDVLPQAETLDVYVENKHLGNFMSITAPVFEDTGRLFAWDNDFAWSYDGEVADSITKRVKLAGGNTDAPLRVSLAWHNIDDLDIHAECPDGHVYYRQKMGILDVDMNVSSSDAKRDAVENLSWDHPRSGHYKIYVHNYDRREDRDQGFTIELAAHGSVLQYHCPDSPMNRATTQCLEFYIVHGRVTDLKVGNSLKGAIVPDKWGVGIEGYVPVNTLMLSPNHWGNNEVGNMHLFFILKDCKNPDSVRGIYNEFLRPELMEHRKVFEVLGNKAKCQFVEDQLSGVGFSSTKKMELSVMVNGNRPYYLEGGW